MGYIIYTDGSTRKNGQQGAEGGFGVVVTQKQDDGNYKIVEAYREDVVGTTNNRMEMEAILWALRNYGDESHRDFGFLIPIVYSDSMYSINSFTNWIRNWKANNWQRANGEQIENIDLIKEYDKLINDGLMIELRYVRGHQGNELNELADELATGRITIEEVMKNI